MSGLALDQPITDPLLGKTLAERYRIVKKLGEGGMGAVYEGEHLVIKKRVAIKVLHPQFAATPEIVARFHQEALAATAIGHEHIVEVNDMGRTPEGALFMVLEYLSGRDFADLLDKESPLPIGRITHIVSQICDAVAAAHEKGIVHRDLKPENVFLIKRGGDPDFAKVLDFGISKMKDGGNSHSQTKTGAIIGTAYYMAPEQAMGKKSIDHRADIWAIGVILFYALTRRFPFEDEAYPMLIVKICSDAAPRASQFRSDLPPELDSLILRCLSKDPDARPQSCAELVALLGPMRALSSVLPGTRLSAPGPAPSSGRTPVSREALAFEATAAGVTQTPALPAQANATPVSAETAASAGLPTRPRWQGPAAIAVVASLLAGGGVYAATQGGSTPEVIPAAVAPPAAVPEAETRPAEPVPEPTPPAAVGHIDFLVSPSEAVVLLDGRPVIADPDGNVRTPTNIDDATIHELRFEARGFRSRVEDLRVSYPQRIVVSLDPGTGVDDRRATATGSAGATRVGRHSSGSSSTGAPGGSSAPTGGATSGGATSGGATSGGATNPTAVAETPTTPTAPREEPASEARALPEGVVAPPPAAALKRTRIP